MARRDAIAAGLLVSVALGMGPCRGLPTFLVDADLDDDGVVTSADLAAATACLGTEIALAEIQNDAGGCPVQIGPPPTGCESADVDQSGRVTPIDVALVAERLGQPVCNGSEALCERGFDQVAYATTHNAMSARFEPNPYSLLVSNQCSGVRVQLEDGIRSLMLDIHWYQPPEADAPDLYLCHSGCAYGNQLLTDGLTEIRQFLDARPAEVISFIIETNADTGSMEAEIRDAFAASGLVDYAYVQTPGTQWPTLGAMVAANQRLVVLTDDSSPHAGCDASGTPCPWYHYLWSQLAFETHFSNSQPRNFSCVDNRGTPGNDLFILNHFLTNNVGSPVYARRVNFDPLLSSRARECWEFQDHIPNFVTVDFYEIGSVLRTTNLLNYLAGQNGGALPN